MVNKVNTLETLVPELRVACSQARTLEELRQAYISFKKRLDRVSPPKNEECREIYWAHKRRILGRF